MQCTMYINWLFLQSLLSNWLYVTWNRIKIVHTITYNFDNITTTPLRPPSFEKWDKLGCKMAAGCTVVSQNSQCPRTDLNKRFLPRPKTITAWKHIPHRSRMNENWNPPHWVPLHRFFKNWFLLIQKQLYSNYIQTHFA